jgi:hypothetical protein
MPSTETRTGRTPDFETFAAELDRLVKAFQRKLYEFVSPDYDEAKLRVDFLNPLFQALGWDVENRAGLAVHQREVEIESRTRVSGRKKRADFLFRVARQERFVTEAKKPGDGLVPASVFQAKSYAWNRQLAISVLTNFREFRIYVVGGKPDMQRPRHGEYRVWDFKQFGSVAREMWDLLARDNVAAGSLDRLIAELPKSPLAGKARQQWLFRPDRTRNVDVQFLDYLDDVRKELAGDLLKHNTEERSLAGTRLNEAVQRILDRILFLRICEDRDIDTGTPLNILLTTWLKATGSENILRPKQRSMPFETEEEAAPYGGMPRRPLYHEIVEHFRLLDHRPPSHVPFFNGQLFKPHFSEELTVGDEFLANFLDGLYADDFPYLFSSMPVEILGSVYERFIGKEVQPQGRGFTIKDKMGERKDHGVYYTPRYIVDYIVEETVGRLLQGRSPKEVASLRIVDPACGSGSFLIRAYERIMEHHLEWYQAQPKEQKAERCFHDADGNLQLTTALKRQILLNNIYGVDLDGQAIEVTQLSLYLRMLQGETRATAVYQPLMYRDEAILPALDRNIKQGNSLIAADMSEDPAELARYRAFDWAVQFPGVFAKGGFDAVIGNPPYGHLLDKAGEEYLGKQARAFAATRDVYVAFIERAMSLLLKPGGRLSFIVPSAWLGGVAYVKLREALGAVAIERVVTLPFDVFRDAYIDTLIFVLRRQGAEPGHVVMTHAYAKKEKLTEIAVPDEQWHRIPLAAWMGSEGRRFIVSQPSAELVARLRASCARCIGGYAEIKRGVLFPAKLLTGRKTSGNSYRYFEGDVYRYDLRPTLDRWVEYGPKMTEYPKELRWFKGPRVLLRRLVNRRQRLMAACAQKTFITNKNLYSVLPREGALEREHACDVLLALLNSKLLSRLYIDQVTQATKDDFPQVTIKDVLGLPAPAIDKVCQRELARLAQKMTGLLAYRQKGTNGSETATLANAMAATDRAIDQLVYRLYGLTPEEMQLVEEEAAKLEKAPAPPACG